MGATRKKLLNQESIVGYGELGDRDGRGLLGDRQIHVDRLKGWLGESVRGRCGRTECTVWTVLRQGCVIAGGEYSRAEW